MNDVLHVIARRALAASSCASEHAVWHAISTELAIDPRGANGPTAKADLIVSEILDSGLIGEGVLHTMRDAAARLLAPGGQLLPMGASVYAMAIELREPETSQADVDLSALGQLQAASIMVDPIRSATSSCRLRSSPSPFTLRRPGRSTSMARRLSIRRCASRCPPSSAARATPFCGGSTCTWMRRRPSQPDRAQACAPGSRM